MKASTKKILLYCYETQTGIQLGQPYLPVRSLVPELSPSGASSLIRYLEIQGYLRSIRVGETTYFQVTAAGKTQLEASFPALNPKPLTEQLVIFLQPPKLDQQFRYLRRWLVKSKLISLSRGVYYAPFGLPVELQSLLHSSYQGHVAVLGIAAWNFGDKLGTLQVAGEFFLPFDTYSGISKRNQRLISILNAKKVLTIKEKQQIASDFQLFYETLQTDPGWGGLVAHHLISPLQIVAEFQSLWTSDIL